MIATKIKILDNFLEENDLFELSNIKLEAIKDNEIKIFHNKIDKNGTILNSECLEKKTLIRLQNFYHTKALKILDELCLEKKHLYDFSEFHIVLTGKNYKFPIHDDDVDKLLSGVVYLKPFKNKGTIFYNNRWGDGKRTIEWKVNRAVFFSRKERETWHSYEGDKENSRLALVYNLMTSKDKIKEVLEIEKKNYFIGLARHKLNPYLYRHFKLLL